MFKICVVLVLVKAIQSETVFEKEANPKLCNFFDTINITGGYRNADESITYEGIRFAKGDYGTFNYVYLANHEKIPVPAHFRGCICEYKNCVRLCCPPNHWFKEITIDNKPDHSCVPNSNVTELNLNYLSNMVFVSEMPCKGFFLDPDEPLDQWRILANGSLILAENLDPLIVDRDGYCFAHVSNGTARGFDTRIIFCADASYKGTPMIIGRVLYPAVMLVSVIFLVITLFVYFWIKELRTLHGKTFMCYLASLIIGYSILAFSHIANWHASNGRISCLILAEATHTAFILGFIWLSIIGYDIWRAVGGARQRRHQFMKYCLFACGATLLIVLLTNTLDHVNLLNKKWRPGFATTVCWLQESKFVHFLYLYLIIIIIMAINTVFFILTKLKIERTRQVSNYATSSEDSKKFGGRDETDADRCQLFFRLVIIMGLPWSIEIISWLADDENFFIYIIDTVTMLIGPLIFFVCVRKPRIRRLMDERWSSMSTLRSSLSKIGIGSSAPSSSNSDAK